MRVYVFLYTYFIPCTWTIQYFYDFFFEFPILDLHFVLLLIKCTVHENEKRLNIQQRIEIKMKGGV